MDKQQLKQKLIDYFEIYTQIKQLNQKDYEELQEFLSEMEQSTPIFGRTIKQYETYIKKFKRKNKILFKTFKTRNKNTLAHICKYILELEWHNEWALAVAGQSTRTIFGWFSV